VESFVDRKKSVKNNDYISEFVFSFLKVFVEVG
jgi:hypothetical protein